MSPQEIKQLKLSAIYEALLELLKDHELSDIGVSELCRQANVSRTYYYRNFQSFEEIITCAQEKDIYNYLRRIPHKSHMSFEELMTIYFEFAHDNKAQKLLLLNAGQTDTLIKTFRTVYTFLVQQGYVNILRNKRARSQYFATFLSGAVVSVETQWIRNGMRESPKNMGNTLCKLIGFDDK
ncbi:TetR/AcrR family transcriptional regulator [Candidatus Enterococcus ferrettii]|uniref:HTH tetR-type domain-containing protein n=1 Tax=Candidatus Enterococcus ferrettii TaxID=2815324 RepID=A0ABV0EM22_9ENTE|nr:TetR-like C-terminal domain-containing protein [Enterococcus sp. 665A]MBO1338219.1 TetR family transcriptional regulator C-terminal domain-containing protein [Enterococcus sp. 665A]